MKKFDTEFNRFFNSDVDTVVDMFLNGKVSETFDVNSDVELLVELMLGEIV